MSFRQSIGHVWFIPKPSLVLKISRATVQDVLKTELMNDRHFVTIQCPHKEIIYPMYIYIYTGESFFMLSLSLGMSTVCAWISQGSSTTVHQEVRDLLQELEHPRCGGGGGPSGSWRSCESEAKCSRSPRWMGKGEAVEGSGGLCLCAVAPSVGLLQCLVVDPGSRWPTGTAPQTQEMQRGGVSMCCILPASLHLLSPRLSPRDLRGAMAALSLLLPNLMRIPPCYLITKLCPTFCDPMDFATPSLPDSSVHVIVQARILEWVAISSFRGSS